MKKLFLTTAVAALAAGAVTPAFAECEIGKAMAYSKEDTQVPATEVRRDLRTLRQAAITLKDLGREDACEELVATIKDIRQDRKVEMTRKQNVERRTGQKSEMKDAKEEKTWTERNKNRMANATPIAQAKGQISATTLVGADLVGTKGETVGEIEDIIMNTDGKADYAVVGFGGFLGLGEEQIAVPFSQLKVAYDDDGDATYYLPMSEEQLENAPRFKRDDREWVHDKTWRQKNDDYYSQNKS